MSSLLQKKKKKWIVWADLFLREIRWGNRNGKKPREGKEWIWGSFLEGPICLVTCHWQLTTGQSYGLNVRMGRGAIQTLLNSFTIWRSLPRTSLPLEDRRQSATERNCKNQTPAVWWGRCRRSSGMMTVGRGFQPVDLSYPQETRRLFRGAEPILSGRLEGGLSWWDTGTSLKRSAPR